MDNAKKWQRARSQTAKIEEASVLGNLHFFKIKDAKSYEHRMSLFQTSWQKRVKQFEAEGRLTPAMLRAAYLCPPCAIKGTTTWACNFRFCPFCYARANADIWRRWKRDPGEHLVSFVDYTFKAVSPATQQDIDALLLNITNAQRRWSRRLAGSIGSVYRVTPFPQKDAGVWTFKLSGIAAFAEPQKIKPIEAAKIWQTQSDVKQLRCAITRTMRYPPTWFYADARRVLSLLAPTSGIRSIRYCGKYYSRRTDGIPPILSDKDGSVELSTGAPDQRAACDPIRLLVNGHADCAATMSGCRRSDSPTKS